MAFALYHESTPSASNSATTTHTVSYPTTVNDGDLLLFIGQWNANNTITLASGWTRLANSAAGFPGSIEVWARIAPVSNTLGGTTFSITSSASQAAAFDIRRYSLTSGALVAGTDYDISSGSGWSDTTTPDPDSVTATWGSDDNTFVAVGGGRGDNDVASAAPTNYGNLTTSVTTNGGGGGAEVYSADRQLAAATDNPATFTLPGTERVFAYTVVLAPEAGVTITLDLPVETDTAPDVSVSGSGSATVVVDLPVETDTAPDVLVFAPDFNAPVFPAATLDMEVELAFGAGGQSPLDWEWVDVSDRRLAQSVAIRRGRSDESSLTQPSTVSLQLDNGDGALTPTNPASPWWPNVRRGTPLRIWVAGDTPALYIPGRDGAFVSTPDHNDFDFAGDIDLRVRVQPDQWSVGIDWASFGSNPVLVQPQRLITKWRAATLDASFDFSIFNAGWPGFQTTPDGENPDPGGTSTEALVAALRPIWLAATFEPDNGASGRTLTLYRFDGDTPPASLTDWTPVRTATVAGTTTVFAGAAAVEIGSRDNGQPSFRGRVLAAEIRDGIDGTVVADPDFTAQPAGTRSFTDTAGKEWTLNGTAEISTRRIRFVGTVDEITPTWPFGDHNPTTQGNPSESRASITASGILRRLSQGAKPLRSALYRHITSPGNRSEMLAYWPGEDDAGAIELAAGIEGQPPLTLTGSIDAGNDDTLAPSGPLPTVTADETASWQAPVGIPPFDKKWAVEWAFRLPTPETAPTETTLMVIDSLGTAQRWEFSISSTTARLRALDTAGAELVNSGSGITGEIFTGWVQAVLIVEEQGASVFWDWTLTNLDIGTGGGAGSSFTGTLGRVTTIHNNLTGPPDGLSFGHIIVHRGNFAADWLAGADSAWAGESAAHRFHRLCAEEDIPVEIIGDPSAFSNQFGDLALSEPMGPQQQQTLLELLGQCVTTDQGVLISRRTAPGLVYRTRQSLYAQTPALRLDASLNGEGEIVAPFTPRLDDQRLRNDITVNSDGGSSARLTDQDCIDQEGLYDEEISISGVGGLTTQQEVLDNQPGLVAAIRRQNLQQAGWRLHLGTWPLMRYPTVTTDLSIAPHLIDDWHDVELGDRVTVEGLPIQHPDETVELVVEAINERLGHTVWSPTLTCSPGGPWLVGVLDT